MLDVYDKPVERTKQPAEWNIPSGGVSQNLDMPSESNGQKWTITFRDGITKGFDDYDYAVNLWLSWPNSIKMPSLAIH